MNVESMREAAAALRDEIKRADESDDPWKYISMMKPEVGTSLADMIDIMADAFDDLGFPAEEHWDAYPAVKIAKSILEEAER